MGASLHKTFKFFFHPLMFSQYKIREARFSQKDKRIVILNFRINIIEKSKFPKDCPPFFIIKNLYSRYFLEKTQKVPVENNPLKSFLKENTLSAAVKTDSKQFS